MNLVETAVNETVKMVENWRKMMKEYPEFEWKSSGAVCVLSDGIAKEVGKHFGGHQLDGNGVDIPSVGWEVTAGKNIQKSHRPCSESNFFWVRRLGNTWDEDYEIRLGSFVPEDFPLTEKGKHGSSVRKSVALAKTKVLFSERAQ